MSLLLMSIRLMNAMREVPVHGDVMGEFEDSLGPVEGVLVLLATAIAIAVALAVIYLLLIGTASLLWYVYELITWPFKKAVGLWERFNSFVEDGGQWITKKYEDNKEEQRRLKQANAGYFKKLKCKMKNPAVILLLVILSISTLLGFKYHALWWIEGAFLLIMASFISYSIVIMLVMLVWDLIKRR